MMATGETAVSITALPLTVLTLCFRVTQKHDICQTAECTYTPRHFANADSVQQQKIQFAMLIVG